MNGLIELEEMSFYAYHGCFKEEQVVGNKFTVNISFTTNCKAAAASDHLSDAVNYVQIYNITKHDIAIKSHLLEHVGARIVNAGANLAVVETKSAGELLFQQSVGGVWLDSPVQVYPDLLRSEGRAKEMPEHLRK